MRNTPVTALLGLALAAGLCIRLVSASRVVSAIWEYPAALCALVLLCPPLERWIGSKKMWQLLGSTGLFALLTGCAMMLSSGYSLAQVFNPDLADGIYLICLLAGIALALSFTGGDKPAETFRLRPAAWIPAALLLLGAYCCIILKVYGFAPVRAPNWFFFVYTLSAGAFGGLYFSWQNQAVTNMSVFDQTRVLPPYEKIKWRRFPGTLCLLAAIITIAGITVAITPKQYLIGLYGSAGFGAWLRYVFFSGFFNWRLESIERMIRWTGVSLETLLKGQLWRPFTAGLMHFGPLHLLGNGAALYLAGKYIEPRVGTLKWLCVFFGSVWVNLLPQFFYTKELLYDGASIGIYALVAVFLLHSFAKGEPPRSRPHEFFYLLGYVFVGNFLSFGPGHFVSFAFGLVAARGTAVRKFFRNFPCISPRDVI
ncbi:MAG: rhomboid family intramembrane serine protease [Oscillospiraceae bacterium]|jgi:membrane associated rhomboid family serine protease|nr:rhomboid family intramembrane serine protease [Oscillospiraceae bacterium]